MTCDYSAISDENRRKYGTEVHEYGRVLLANLYGDRTHFLYELLQNAEDAGATTITFNLSRTALEVQHDGRPFDERDVRGICGIVAGAKRDDLTTIGRFGIGFKSVYAYTRLPEVHSGAEHFAIENYVHPKGAAPRAVPSGETLLVFPFNRVDATPEAAFGEISDRLRTLGSRTLLFLRNLNEITWQTHGEVSGAYLRETREEGSARWVTLIGETDRTSVDEQWLVYNRSVATSTAYPLFVEIAFRINRDRKTNRDAILPVRGSKLVVFFPTEKETHLGYVINGPYRTTPARDNIPAEDSWNRELIQSTATLTAAVLPDLRYRGLLTGRSLEALPIRESDFPKGSMFRPVFEAVSDAFQHQRLLPTHDGPPTPASRARVTRSSAIRELLNPDQLTQLFQPGIPLHFVTGDVSVDRTPDVWQYMRQVLKIAEIDPESIARQFTEHFIQGQSDEWVAAFYRFLSTQEALWRKPRWDGDRSPLRDKPFIRLEGGRHVPPFGEGEVPNAYLTTGNLRNMSIVRRCISADETAYQFLTRLGLGEPDIVAVVVEHVLPKYIGDGDRPDLAEHLQDVESVACALSTASAARRDQLRQFLRESQFFRCSNAATGGHALARPGTLYIRTPKIEAYFHGNGDVFFLDNIYSKLRDELSSLGLSKEPRVQTIHPDGAGNVVYKAVWGHHKRGIAGFDPSFALDGLKHALSHPTPDVSVYIWNELLRPNSRHVSGEIEESTRQTFESPTRRRVVSKFGRLVRDATWLPDTSGTFHKPSEIELTDLPAEFVRDEQLAKKLKMRSSAISRLASESGIPVDILQALREQPDTVEEFRDLLRKRRKSLANQHDGGRSSAETFDYTAGLRAAFSYPPVRDQDETSPSGAIGDLVVPNPALRRDRTNIEIGETIRSEPSPSERFKRVLMKNWEGKNNDIRTFLEAEYGGKCQICGETFLKRDGHPYFEGVYLVPHTTGRWIDRSGNVLCLCANCSAKLMHGPVEAPNVVDQIKALRVRREGGNGDLSINIRLCGEPIQIRFSERHLIDLQEIIRVSERSGNSGSFEN